MANAPACEYHPFFVERGPLIDAIMKERRRRGPSPKTSRKRARLGVKNW